MILLPFPIQPTHGQVIALGDVKRNLVLGDPLVREMADQMARVGAAKLIASAAGLVLDQRVQLAARHVRVSAVGGLAGVPGGGQGVAQPALGVVGAGEDKGAAKVSLPGLEDGAQVDKQDVTGLDGAVGRRLLVREQGVRAAAHDALVPVRLDAVARGGERVDLFAELGLGDARADEVALDLVEEGDGLVLGVEQGVCSLLLRERGGLGRHGDSFLSFFLLTRQMWMGVTQTSTMTYDLLEVAVKKKKGGRHARTGNRLRSRLQLMAD